MCTCLQNSRGVTIGSRKNRGARKWGGGGELIKAKATKGCKHARNTESPPACVVNTQRGMTGLVETFKRNSSWVCGGHSKGQTGSPEVRDNRGSYLSQSTAVWMMLWREDATQIGNGLRTLSLHPPHPSPRPGCSLPSEGVNQRPCDSRNTETRHMLWHKFMSHAGGGGDSLAGASPPSGQDSAQHRRWGPLKLPIKWPKTPQPQPQRSGLSHHP